MNTLAAIRLAKLQEVCRNNEWGPSELARRMGGGAVSQWSELLRGKKSFGEKLARKIEASLGMPPWSLDTVATKPSTMVSPSARALRIATGLDELSQGELREVIFDTCERLLQIQSLKPRRKLTSSKRVPPNDPA
jgi:hypothetical protein